MDEPLISVSQVAAAGNEVTQGAHSGRIVNKRTGLGTLLTRGGSVCILRMRVNGKCDGKPSVDVAGPRNA